MKSKQTAKTKFIWIALLFTMTLSVFFNNAKAQTPVDDPYLGIIPAPSSVIKNTGTFDFSKMTLIKADNPNDRSVALLKSFLINNRHFNNRVSKYS
jgi:hexosaminidase